MADIDWKQQAQGVWDAMVHPMANAAGQQGASQAGAQDRNAWANMSEEERAAARAASLNAARAPSPSPR